MPRHGSPTERPISMRVNGWKSAPGIGWRGDHRPASTQHRLRIARNTRTHHGHDTHLKVTGTADFTRRRA